VSLRAVDGDSGSHYLEVAVGDALQYRASISIEHSVLALSVMKALTHITAGRTAIRTLLVVAVLTAGIVGTSGPGAAEPMDGKGDDPFPPSLYSLDGKGNDVYPPPARQSLGWMETGDVTSAFPIDNVTVGVEYAGRGGGSGKASL
jgi:hypothetical protein